MCKHRNRDRSGLCLSLMLNNYPVLSREQTDGADFFHRSASRRLATPEKTRRLFRNIIVLRITNGYQVAVIRLWLHRATVPLSTISVFLSPTQTWLLRYRVGSHRASRDLGKRRPRSGLCVVEFYSVDLLTVRYNLQIKVELVWTVHRTTQWRNCSDNETRITQIS